MKRYITGILITTFIWMVPGTLRAEQTFTTAELQAQINQIRALIERVKALQSALAFSAQTSIPKKAVGTVQSDIYDGPYERVYGASGNTLTGGHVRSDDKRLWDAFVGVTGITLVRNYINEFRIFNESDSYLGAFIEPKGDGTWMLGFNRQGTTFSDLLNDSEIYALMIHEYAHVYFEEIAPSLETAFVNTFWNTDRMEDYEERLERAIWPVRKAERYYEDYPTDFVSAYAALSPTEDLAETFSFFVTEARPSAAAQLKDQKILFFYNYPALITLRQQLKSRLPF